MPDQTPDVDDLRVRLRELGYLDAGVNRFVLGPVRRGRSPFASAWRSSLRIGVLAGLLALVTWIPGLLLFGMQVGMAGWSWFAANWTLGAAVAGGFFLWSLLLGLVAMASSAYVRWRVIAGALVLAFFFVLAGAAQLIKAVTGVEWALALNPGEAMNRLWSVMLGVELKPGPGALECAVSLGVMALLLCWILERKLRPVEVVS